MKLVSSFCAALSILIGVTAWKYTEPFISQNGTTVIHAMSSDGKLGNKPLTVKITEELSAKQHELLNFAFDVAKSDGIKFPQYLQSILMKESRGCDMKNFRVAGLTNKVGDRYFGCGQIKLAAAKAVMNSYPDMWKYLESKTDEELQARLILDDRFNIRVASKYAIMMGINENPDRAITAYNVGPGAVKNVDPGTHNYTRSVKEMSKGFKNVQGKGDEIKSSNKPINLARNEYPN
jgi:hypothetical protein